MNFTLVTNLVKQIISAIENSAVSAVRVITKNTFLVTVTNPVKKVEVRGQVTVANQKNVERLIKEQTAANKLIEKAVVAESKLTRSTTVANFPKPIDLTPLTTVGAQQVAATKEVSADVQSLHTTLSAIKSIEVSNQPLTQIEGVRLEASKIYKAIQALKLDPKISVEAPKPERIVVPPAQVTVEKTEIDYKKIASAIADNVPGVDYKKLEKLLAESIGAISIGGGGGGRSYSYQTSDGTKTQALVDDSGRLVMSEYFFHDMVQDATYQYLGEARMDGSWRITRITKATKQMRYFFGTSDYPTNFANYASLAYDYIYA